MAGLDRFAKDHAALLWCRVMLFSAYRTKLLIGLAVAGLLALLAAGLWQGPRPASEPAPDLARLPGRPADAPLLVRSEAAKTPAVARARNAAIPFFAGKLTAATPFRFTGGAADLANARECLALAAMAEAGPSDAGQRAVMQVILNRVRHPAFARTVCGVVFEGSERATGCQFTFTCDGSITRRYGLAAWDAARSRAEAMLKGGVYAPVGNATHYHTDWVFPWWSPKLEKLARVETHLFLRWPGYWGSSGAARMAYRGGEPQFAALIAGKGDVAALAPQAMLPQPDLPADTPKIDGGAAVVMRLASGKANFIELAPGTGPAGTLVLAKVLCNKPGTCRVMGWRNRSAIPAAFPLPPAARASLSFSYTRDPAGTEIVLFDCQAFSGLPREQCIPRAR